MKNEYNLDKIDNLILLKIKIQRENNLENDKVGFEVYADLNGNNILTRLDLNICGDSLVNNEISKCNNYSIESFLDDLCISCYESYYPIYNDVLNKNSYIKCYHDPKGYYLDNNDKNYKKCYSSCETCGLKGNSTYHNCLSCSKDYSYELTIKETINCYKSCDYYTYYNPNTNKNYCTSDHSCPKDFNELIPNQNKCIDDCTKDSNFPYEFRRTCFQECP